MNYEDVCSFIETNPLVAFQICHQAINNQIQQTLSNSEDESQVRVECEGTLRKTNNETTANKGIRHATWNECLPQRLEHFYSMVAWSKQTDFWIMHKELCVFLRWNEEGFFKMSQEESNWHNKKHSENHWLLPKKEFSSSSAAPHDYSAHNLSTTSAAPASLCANYNYVVDLQDSNSVGDSFAAEPNALEGDFDAHDEDDESDKSDDDSSAQAPSKQAWTCSSGGGNDGSRGGGEHAQVGTKRPFSTPSVAVSVADSSTASQISQKQKKTRTSRAYFWTQETDDKLAEAMQTSPTNWNAVVAYVGKSKKECSSRWYSYLRSALQQGTKQGTWSADEIELLREVVPQSKQPGMCKETIDWQAVAQRLSRTPRDCANKWTFLATEHFVKGKFSLQEDAVIKCRVAEWRQKNELEERSVGGDGVRGGNSGSSTTGERQKELWESLEKELNRQARQVEERWNRLAKWM